MSYITAIGTANPQHRYPQQTIAEFMVRAMELSHGDDRKLKTIFKASGIDYRHTVLEDYGKIKDFTFYFPSGDFNVVPGTQKRLHLFQQHALPLSIAAVQNLASAKHYNADAITHLIVVCCTGMYAPGLDIELVKSLNLSTTVQRTAITFMGCYAAFNALKAADAFCKSDANANVLIVCTELCSLHFQREGNDNNLLANALFADGAAAVLVQPKKNDTIALKLEQFFSDLAPEGDQDMAWTIGDVGFEMRLSSYVPDIIKSGIAKLTDTLLAKLSKKFSDIKHFAIHPGGKKILEAIEQELGISKEQNQSAYYVLKNYGNMSSPTVLFVLKDVFEKLTPENKNEHILSFAFGPGLTMESMILKIEADA